VEPLACIITNVERDHTEYLGENLTDIALEKAGIIKTTAYR
jgi:dihydrofolate synthase/folylpolyglutamate synthase